MILIRSQFPVETMIIHSFILTCDSDQAFLHFYEPFVPVLVHGACRQVNLESFIRKLLIPLDHLSAEYGHQFAILFANDG